MGPERATIDFETRSACSLSDAGSWRYSLDPTTEILCLVVRLPYWRKGRTVLWHPAFPHLGIEEGCDDWDALGELFAWIELGGLVEAHNAWFERGIWKNILVRAGWPDIDHFQWRCSAAKAAAHALPRKLEKVGEALFLDVQKDKVGHDLMKKMCKPRKPKKSDHKEWRRKHDGCATCMGLGKVPAFKKDGSAAKRPKKCESCEGKGHLSNPVPEMPLLYHESRELFESLWAYCRVDVLAEEAVSVRLDDLNPDETGHYVMDQIINERGFGLDVEAVDCALALIDDECSDLNQELALLTEGKVLKATQREKMTEWFAEMGLDLENTQKDTIEELLETHAKHPEWRADERTDQRVWRALELVRVLGRSSTAKYVTMREQVCPDSRVHGGLLYHGASTGRWTGSGVQPHNFVKGKIADMEKAWQIIKSRDVKRIISEVVDKKGKPIGTVLDVLAHALRGAIVPSPGMQLYVADYAAIEARVVLWLARDDDALNVFLRGEDIYCYMAEDIYGYPCNKDDHPDERGIGKIAVLGLGYQMGWKKFIETAALGGVTLTPEFAKKIVAIYREKFWRVKEMWYEQEAAAITAVEEDREVVAGRVSWFMENGFLFCELPSGRKLAYSEPEVNLRPMPWDDNDLRPQLTTMGINPYNRQWDRQPVYGGLLVENQTQAVARDLMAEAAWRCEWSEFYKPVLTVHDELIAEAPIGMGDVKEFEELMALCPDWAAGCPVAAEGWRGLRYRK